ncbi:MAG: hopanoid-associated sugar epimerase [Acidimicrobiales bacterium]
MLRRHRRHAHRGGHQGPCPGRRVAQPRLRRRHQHLLNGPLTLQRGDRVLVTGATGFVGSAVTRALVQDGRHVVALVEEGADARNLDGLEVEQVRGDVRDPAAVRSAVNGCQAVFHVAALYRFWAREPRDFYEINVDGTRNVLDAARAAGTGKVVFTSSVGTLGLEAAGGRAANELAYPDLRHLFGAYKRSKYVAEHEALRAAAEGLPLSIVQPTFPLGPGDRAPTPTGRFVLDYLQGRIPGYVDTVLNVAHVDDVGRGHVLALERGRPGRSYILGGENLPLREVLSELAALTGLRQPAFRVPAALALAAARVSETLEGSLLRRHPTIPLEATRMSTTRMAYDDSRARRELGYSPRPAAEAIEASVRWFVENGYLSPRRQAKITWGPSPAPTPG